jgi:hypothetical protein
MRSAKVFCAGSSSVIPLYQQKLIVGGSVADPNPDPPDPHVFGRPGSGSTISQRYGSGSGSCSGIRIRILLSLSKYSTGKKNIDLYCFVTSF